MSGVISEKRDHTVFYSLLAMLLGLCVIRHTFQISIPQVLLLGIACLMTVLGDRDEILAMCMCGISLQSSFPTHYVLMLAMIVYVLRYGGEIRLGWAIALVLFLIAWDAAHCFGADFLPTQFVGRFMPLVLVGLLISSRSRSFDYAFIVRVFSVCALAMCCSLVGKHLYLAGFDIWTMLASLQRLGIVTEQESKELLVTGADINANSLGVVCVLGITGLLQLRLTGKGKSGDFGVVAGLLMFGVSTSSRTFMVCLLLMAVLLIFSLRSTTSQKIQYFGGVVFILTVVAIAMNFLVPGLLEFYLNRFLVEDISAGRGELLLIYTAYIFSHLNVLLWGIGAQDFGAKVTDIYQVNESVPHNAIQELMIAWGVPGLFIFGALLVCMITGSKRINPRMRLINYIPLIIILAKAQAGQMITSEYTLLAFSLAYLSMCADLQPGSADRRLESPQLDMVDTFGIDFGRAVALLWRKKFLIAAAAIIGAVGAYGITAVAVTPRYESKAMFFVNNARIELKNPKYGIYSSEIFVSRSLVDTYKVILGTRDTLNQVIEQTGVDLTYEELRSMVRATTVNETEIFEVKVTSEDPAQAELLANTIAEVLPGRIAGIVDGAAASVVDYAVKPASPSWPSKSTHAMLGFILGFVGVVTIILLRAMLDTTMRTEADLMAAYPYPVLSAIPDLMERNKKKSSYYYYNYSHYGYYQHDGKDESTERG